MTGILAQIITLTAFGNDYLRSEKLPSDFYSGNTNFKFCNKVDFRVLTETPPSTAKPKETIVADNPENWFNYLKNDGCKKLRLYFHHSNDQSFAKDHQSAGFVGGGGTWLIEAISDNYSNAWDNRWEVTRKNDPTNKIWTVNYIMTVKKIPTINLQIDPLKTKDKLKQTLYAIANFAFKHDLENWGKLFDDAKAILDSREPEGSYYKDLVPVECYSLPARQILFAAASAWVFGGMGSWNDLGFESNEDNDLYNRLSEQLYSNINEAIISAINSAL